MTAVDMASYVFPDIEEAAMGVESVCTATAQVGPTPPPLWMWSWRGTARLPDRPDLAGVGAPKASGAAKGRPRAAIESLSSLRSQVGGPTVATPPPVGVAHGQ